MATYEHEDYAPTVLRLILGVIFFLPGIMKFMSIEAMSAQFATWGIPAAGVMIWLVAIVETLLGLALILGFKVKYAVWPLMIILLVGIIVAIIPSFATDQMAMMDLLFHLLGMGGLVSLFLTGPGEWAVGE